MSLYQLWTATVQVAATPGLANHFVIQPVAGDTAGSELGTPGPGFEADAVDSYCNLVTSYAGSVKLTSTDPKYVHTSRPSLSGGCVDAPAAGATTYLASFAAGKLLENPSAECFYTAIANPVTLTITDSLNPLITGSVQFSVSPAPGILRLTSPTLTMPHGAINTATIVATVTDSFNNPVSNQTITFSDIGVPSTSIVCTSTSLSQTTVNTAGGNSASITLSGGPVAGSCVVTASDPAATGAPPGSTTASVTISET